MRIVVKETKLQEKASRARRARRAADPRVQAAAAARKNPVVLNNPKRSTAAQPAANTTPPAAPQKQQVQAPPVPGQPQNQADPTAAAKPADPTAAAKPVNKEKTLKISKKIFGVIPWLSTKIKGSPELLRAYMGTINKAQQYAGTQYYIPLMVQGLVAAGVPKAEAEKAAQEVAKTDNTTQTPAGGQQPAEPVQPPVVNQPDTAPTAGKPDTAKPPVVNQPDTAPTAGKPDTAKPPGVENNYDLNSNTEAKNLFKDTLNKAKDNLDTTPLKKAKEIADQIGKENIEFISSNNVYNKIYVITKYTAGGKNALFIISSPEDNGQQISGITRDYLEKTSFERDSQKEPNKYSLKTYDELSRKNK